MSAKTEFKKVYWSGQPNFITSEVVRYGRRGSKVYELSFGKGFCSKELWGVTFVEAKEKLHSLSRCFTTQKDAEAYIGGIPR